MVGHWVPRYCCVNTPAKPITRRFLSYTRSEREIAQYNRGNALKHVEGCLPAEPSSAEMVRLQILRMDQRRRPFVSKTAKASHFLQINSAAARVER